MFKIGDTVVAIAPKDHPYKYTCDGWEGKVTKLYSSSSGYDMEVIGTKNKNKGPYDVNFQYFKLKEPDEGEMEIEVGDEIYTVKIISKRKKDK